MENVKILIDGIQKDVYGLFYIYDSKYYFIYTEKELDQNDYVILYMCQVGKETKNTENGAVDTGYLVGVEVTNPDEQTKVQISISKIVEHKKNNTISSEIQYLPMSMLANLKIVSKKRFRLLKSIMEENFNLDFSDLNQPIVEPSYTSESISETPSKENITISNEVSNDDNIVIIDYRSKYFEEQQKNEEMQNKIEELTRKIEEIKKVIE